MEIAPGIHLLKVPLPVSHLEFLNCYLVAGKPGWLMVDTGWYTRESLQAMEDGLHALGLDFTDIATIVVTHVHPDHFGLAGKIKQLSPRTRLVAHKWEWALIESRYIKFADLQHQMGILLKRHGVPESKLPAMEAASLPVIEFVSVTMPDDAVYGGETIQTGLYDLEVIWTPGHSSGHICLYEPRNRLLFSGDHILPQITPNVSYHVQSGDNPLGDFLYSLQKLQNLSVSQILPAHQEVFSNLPARINQIVQHHHRRKKEMLVLMQGLSRTAYELSCQVTWDIQDIGWEDFPPQLQRIAITETIAHLEYMRWEGKVKRSEHAGLLLY
ncbi:MAG: hypothetical protein A2Y91_06030, partial [Chloroflexi bacterium RBG_13_54_8]